jgi:hypothetical protein
MLPSRYEAYRSYTVPIDASRYEPRPFDRESIKTAVKVGTEAHKEEIRKASYTYREAERHFDEAQSRYDAAATKDYRIERELEEARLALSTAEQKVKSSWDSYVVLCYTEDGVLQSRIRRGDKPPPSWWKDTHRATVSISETGVTVEGDLWAKGGYGTEFSDDLHATTFSMA